MIMEKVDSAAWKTLADQKEKEWRGILESRIESLEKECKEKDNQLISEKSKFDELKEHFKYNLKLLEERDNELEKYDVTYSELRTSLNSKNAEISELKIHLDDLKNVIKREEKTREELLANYQKRLREKQMEVDSYKNSKDEEVQDERKEYEQFRRNLQLQLLNVQTELDTQKSQLTIEFDNALKKREHEFRVQFDEINAKALEYELKARLVEKELELTRESCDKTTAATEEAETSQRKLEKLIKHKEWELADTTAIKDSQIAELESKLSFCESAMKKMQEDFQRKYTEMDKMIRDKESAIERTKNGYMEKEEALQAIIQGLQSKLEDAQIRERQLTWSNQDLVKEKEVQVEKLQEELNDVKEKWSRHIAEISREHVTHDLELSTALEEQRRLKLELEQRKDDLQRYRNELKAAAEREEKLDKAKTQIELDWQRRCEELEKHQYDKSEDLIKRLTTARNEAQALVKERERELHNKILLVKSLYRERDQLRTLLKKHNISANNFVQYSLDEESEVAELNYMEDLQRQNEGLKELIAQMRLQMEDLGQESQQVDTKSPLVSSSLYTKQIQELRKENQKLKEKLASARTVGSEVTHLPTTRNTEEVLSQVESNTAVKNHIIALNSAIGNLRSEKVELAATVKKQQARIAYLENSLEELSKQVDKVSHEMPRQKQVQIDQLIYELNSYRRRHEVEVAGLKGRVSELEFQLSEARREADEYHRASLERNEELVALGNQLSALKMEMSESNPPINFGAQELYIQQLQDELNQLRKRATALDNLDVDNRFASLGGGSGSADLKHKIKSAAARIVQLAKENQQLIESNNRLRAELKSAVSEKRSSAVISDSLLPFEDKSFGVTKQQNEDYQSSAALHDRQSSTTLQDRLQQLEKLQYQLTKQELQFAHRFKAGTGGKSTTSIDQSFEEVHVPEKDSSDFKVKDRQLRSFKKPSGTKVSPDLAAFPLTSQDTDPQVAVSFSSGGGDSIQKVWQMLEESSPTTPRSPHRSTHSSPHKSPHQSPRNKLQVQSKQSGYQHGTKNIQTSYSGDEFFLEGQPAPIEVKSCKDHSFGTTGIGTREQLKKTKKQKQKIRNYNVKEDASRR